MVILRAGSSTNAALCYQRALPGADAVQTPTILTKLAGIYQSIAQQKHHEYSEEAVDCHRKIIALGERENKPAHMMAASYLAVAEYEMYAPRPAASDGRRDQARDLTLAMQYLHKIAQTNAPQRDKAEELLRKAKAEEAAGFAFGR